MALTTGTRLGPYEIQAPLGAGGMGEVYRGRDTRLERTVAIKVLSPALVPTPELRARFEREARAIAGLQHPNICVLHDVGHEHDTPYLVMEYLEGETLETRLRKGRLPLAEVLRLGAQIAAALERAHQAGIVHRDLKPANVMLTKTGAKLLDFGLAKPRHVAHEGAAPSFTAIAAPGLAATAFTSPVTQAGMVLGTAPYMSPEQIEGREADARSDIFALGCVLYEMTSGQRPFTGASGLSLAAAILEKEPPPLRAAQPGLPRALDHVIEVCLRKAPEQRWQAAADVGVELAWIAQAGADLTSGAGPAVPRWRRLVWPGAAALLATAVAALLLWPRAAAPEMVAEISAPADAQFALGGPQPSPPAISPDGSMLVFVGRGTGGHTYLWLRERNSFEARQLPGTENADYPFWSPDGSALGFFRSPNSVSYDDAELMVLNLASGQPQPLQVTGVERGASWGADGTILFTPGVSSPIMRVSSHGGSARPATQLDLRQFSSHRYPWFLPDGKHFLYLALRNDNSALDMIYFAALDGSVNRPLVHALSGGVYAVLGGTGYLLYGVNGTLMAQAMDSSSGELHGPARPLAPGVWEDTESWLPAFTASREGTVVYASGDPGGQQLAWVDRAGHVVSKLPPLSGTNANDAVDPRTGRVALGLDNATLDIWVYNPATGGAARLTHGPVANQFPVWSPDGQWLAYGAWHNGHTQVARRRADGSGAEIPLNLQLPDSEALPCGWSPDGAELLVYVRSPVGRYELRAVALASGASRELVASTPLVLVKPGLSPDGHWASYLAGPGGDSKKLNLVSFRGGQGTWQVLDADISSYFWASDHELLAVDTNRQLLSIAVTEQDGAPSFGAPRVLATDFPYTYAATPDGKQFLVATYPNDQQHLVRVTHAQPH